MGKLFFAAALPPLVITTVAAVLGNAFHGYFSQSYIIVPLTVVAFYSWMIAAVSLAAFWSGWILLANDTGLNNAIAGTFTVACAGSVIPAAFAYGIHG